MLRHLLLLSLAASTAVGLSCYGYTDYHQYVETLHHRTFCSAVYQALDGTAVFGGGDRHPSHVPKIVNMTKGSDCVLEHVDNSKYGYPSSDMWNCYCFSDMCNYPFTFKEFERRGHTLKPTFAMGSD
ncbi:unnamed protein product [Caenorhabditis nigoni]|uniref:Uncharacterized protein n=1 Tax=Caenorhabditis nigoni TaxID=1611254 RepID=A0A2G5T4S1_9PELO|nr:hypothetical protein B9Z55_026687 [Caenorhabditis nigoni]